MDESIHVQKHVVSENTKCPYCNSKNIKTAIFRDWPANRYWNTPLSISGYYCIDCDRFFFTYDEEDDNV